MTGRAFRVVRAGAGLHIPVRIVTGCAADSIIRGVVAFAVAQTIRLKAYVLNAARTVHGNLRPGTVTLPAEVRHFLRGQSAKFSHGPASSASRAARSQMLLRWPVASLALHAFDHSRERGLRESHDIGGVAIETLPHFRGFSQTARGLEQVAGRDRMGAHGQIEPAQAGKVTHAALVPTAVPREDIRLPGHALPEGPVDRYPYCLLAIGHGVDGLLAGPRNLVGISSNPGC